MIFTSFILFFGFIIFAFSNFGGTIVLESNINNFICGYDYHLTLLPSIILYFYKSKIDGKGKFNEQSSIDYYKVSKEIISYWNSNNILRSQLAVDQKIKFFLFTRDHLQQMACLEFTMSWPEP